MDKPEKSGNSYVRWVVLLLLCLMYLITYLDRVSLANTATVIMKQYGFSKATMGVIFSSFIWAYALFQVPGGWLGDRFGPRRVLSCIMVYRTVIAVLTTMATGFYSLWGIRFALGVGEAGKGVSLRRREPCRGCGTRCGMKRRLRPVRVGLMSPADLARRLALPSPCSSCFTMAGIRSSTWSAPSACFGPFST